ncbi:MAG TPA: hypothetical protein G4N94_11805 [Caldilineae bacterium]|nr:hypothetical protein [Caldilineae bacterium]
MKTLDLHLREQSPVMLRAIAQSQGLVIDAAGQRAFRQALVEQMLDRAHIAEVWQDLEAPAHQALQALRHEENRIPVTAFQRRFGEIRRFGPGYLQKEKPWKHPANVAEQLWYLGLLARGFVETADGLAEFFSIPGDLLPLLPLPNSASERFAFPPAISEPLQPPGGGQDHSNDQGLDDHLPEVDSRKAGERFLDDLATVLIHLQQRRVWVDSRGDWRKKDLQLLAPKLKTPPPDPDHPLAPGGRLALIFHCARALGLVQTVERRQRLHGETVRPWLEQSRQQQVATLFAAWRDSAAWNDLCLTPGLHCERGNWRNDPGATRLALLDILGQAQTGQWLGLDAFIAAIHEQRPDFQRPDGNYDTWYIRDDDGSYLKGFEHWDDVEGRLLRYLWSGPLHWLGVIALDGEGQHWRLTPAGLAMLHPDASSPPAAVSPPPLVVTADFHITLPPNHRLYDRLRVARFCVWEASLPDYRYRITQRGLRRAAAAGISPEQVLAFLTAASGEHIPDNVRSALTKFTP